MIARLWRGRAADAAKADAYVGISPKPSLPSSRTLPATVAPGCCVAKSRAHGVHRAHLWDSRTSIEAFTGRDISKSVVEPEARAVLSAFDDFATHYEVAFTGMK